MQNRWLFAALLWVATLWVGPARAVEGIYVGGEVGYTEVTGRIRGFSNAIGFGVDLGVRSNALLDVIFHLQASSHSAAGDLSIYSQALSAQVHWAQVNDFDFILGAGPGFYFFKTATQTNTAFGVNALTGVDVKVDDALRVGLLWRYNLVLGTAGDNTWQAMMKVGYWFDLGP